MIDFATAFFAALMGALVGGVVVGLMQPRRDNIRPEADHQRMNFLARNEGSLAYSADVQQWAWLTGTPPKVASLLSRDPRVVLDDAMAQAASAAPLAQE